MAEVASAGTIIGAVLETAGYVTQSRILADFKEFFDVAGAYIYVFVCIAAILSMAVFGAYKMGLYLILAPALFHFLVGSTSNASSVAFRLGGEPSDAVSVEKAFGGNLQHLAPNGEIKVSSFFHFYTASINGIVASIVEAMMKFNYDAKMLGLVRLDALRSIANVKSDNPALYQMLVSALYGTCGEMRQISELLSSRSLGNTEMAALKMRAESNNAGEGTNDRDIAQTEYNRRLATIARLRDRFNEESDRVVEADPLFVQQIRQDTEKYLHGGGGRNWAAHFNALYPDTYNADPQAFLDELGIKVMKVRAGDIWDIANSAVTDNARYFVEKKLGFAGDKADTLVSGVRSKAGQEALCRELVEKLRGTTVNSYDNYNNCKDALVSVAGSFMVRDALLNTSVGTDLNRLYQKAALIEGEDGWFFADEPETPMQSRRVKLEAGQSLIPDENLPGERGLFIDEKARDDQSCTSVLMVSFKRQFVDSNAAIHGAGCKEYTPMPLIFLTGRD